MGTLTRTTIDRVDVMVLRHVLSRTRYFSTGSNTTRDSVVVRMEDRARHVGWGETYLVPGSVEAARSMAEGLMGITAERACEAVITRLAGDRATHRWALGAVSVALDDLRARQQALPLGVLYGPTIRERVQAYASSAGYVAGEQVVRTWVSEAQALRDQGFRHLKLRIGRYPLADELPAIEAAHGSAPDLAWMADGNGAYGAEDASRLGAALAGMGFLWLEEPVPTDDLPLYARLRGGLGLPLAGGESIETVDGAADAVAIGAYDIIQPDASICGGVGPLLEIARVAAAKGVACVPHACNGAISLAATLQLLSVLPESGSHSGGVPLMLEHDSGENPLRSALLRDTPHVRDGWMAIPSGPGLGVEVDEAAVARAVIPWP